MYVAIEMTIGCIAFGICPAEKDKSGYPFNFMIIGRVTHIDESKMMGERDITLEADVPDKVTVELPEWRISEFDFGGVPMPNPWFDKKRIEDEDTAILGFNPH